MVEILWNYVGTSVEAHLVRNGSLNLCSNYSLEIAQPAGKCHQQDSVTTFTCQLVKCNSCQKSKTQSSCQLNNTAF